MLSERHESINGQSYNTRDINGQSYNNFIDEHEDSFKPENVDLKGGLLLVGGRGGVLYSIYTCISYSV